MSLPSRIVVVTDDFPMVVDTASGGTARARVRIVNGGKDAAALEKPMHPGGVRVGAHNGAAIVDTQNYRTECSARIINRLKYAARVDKAMNSAGIAVVADSTMLHKPFISPNSPPAAVGDK